MGANHYPTINSKTIGTAFPISRKVLIPLALMMTMFYLYWGSTSQQQVIIVEESIRDSEIHQNEPLPPKPPAKSKDEFLVADRGFWKGLGSTKGHYFDSTLANALIKFLKEEKVKTLLELGAGTGAYAKLIKAEGIFISCYDGNPDTQDLSEGRCAVVDLSKPIDFCKHEWLLSFEVGEHIPREFEDVFMNNLDKGNMKGVILSWAIEGQGGTSHVNTRNNSYIRTKMENKGYTSDVETEKALRAAATAGWFKNTIMVFRR